MIMSSLLEHVYDYQLLYSLILSTTPMFIECGGGLCLWPAGLGQTEGL